VRSSRVPSPENYGEAGREGVSWGRVHMMCRLRRRGGVGATGLKEELKTLTTVKSNMGARLALCPCALTEMWNWMSGSSAPTLSGWFVFASLANHPSLCPAAGADPSQPLNRFSLMEGCLLLGVCRVLWQVTIRKHAIPAGGAWRPLSHTSGQSLGLSIVTGYLCSSPAAASNTGTANQTSLHPALPVP
jgi:hypothetical protein